MVEMTTEECWERLSSREFGRLAYRIVDEIHLVPINYVVDARSLLMRTAAGNKLFAAALGSAVALEIDWYDEATAWSVTARGHLRRLGEDEQHRLDQSTQQPWVSRQKPEVVELVPEALTGRHFVLHADDRAE